MKKLTSIPLFIILFTINAHSQDFGYKTIDVGGEYQWQPDGLLFNTEYI